MKTWIKVLIGLGVCAGGAGCFFLGRKIGMEIGEEKGRKEMRNYAVDRITELGMESLEDEENDPEEACPEHPGVEPLTDESKKERVDAIVDLITTMAETDAYSEDMISTMKYGLDYILSEQENHIQDLMNKYLGGDTDGDDSLKPWEMSLEFPAVDEDFTVTTAHDATRPDRDRDSDAYTDGDIPQFHPQDLLPVEIKREEAQALCTEGEPDSRYDLVKLDFYTEDQVVFDPLEEKKWTHPDQLLGVGCTAIFNHSKSNTIYIRNDTMSNVYKITRIFDSFSRLYEEDDDEEEN